jgi:hypothetical protein
VTILDDDEIERLYASRRPTNERELLDWERDFPPNEPSFSRRRVAIMFWASFLAIVAAVGIFIAWRVGREIDAVTLPSAAPAPPHQLEDSRRDRILLDRLATEQARKSQQESTMKKKAAKKSPPKKKKVTHPAKTKKIVNLPPAQSAAPAGDPNEQRAEAAGHEQGGESASDETIED